MATIRKLRGRWQAQVRRRGMKPRAKSFDTKLEAEKWARELEAQVDRFGAAPCTKILESTTLADLLRRYQKEVSPTKRGAEQEIQRIDVLLRHEIAHRTLVGLSPTDISMFRDERLHSVAASTTVRELAILSHVLEVAIRDWGLPLGRNVVKLVRRPTVNDARNRRLVDNEEQRLLAACDAGKLPWLRSFVTLAIETGMRRGELLALRWRDVDLDRRVALLHITKNGSARHVPLSSRAIEALSALSCNAHEQTASLFPTTAGSLECTWQRLCKRAAIVGLRLHDLRHEGISRLFERGLSVIEVAAISGHRELRMLSRYTHLRADDLALRLT